MVNRQSLAMVRKLFNTDCFTGLAALSGQTDQLPPFGGEDDP